MLAGEGRVGRHVCQHEPQGDVVGGVRDDVARVAQHRGCIVERIEERPTEDERPDLVQSVLERDRDAEVAGAAAESPEELGVLVLGRGDEPPVGRDQVDREEAVDRQAVPAREPADAAAEGETRDTGVGDLAARDGEPVRLRLPIEIAPEGACLHARHLRPGIDPDALHPREVEHDAAVDGRVAGRRVAAPANRQLRSGLPRMLHDRDHVDGSLHPGDRSRAAVEHAVPDAPRLVVRRIARPDELSVQTPRQDLEALPVLDRGHRRLLPLNSL